MGIRRLLYKITNRAQTAKGERADVGIRPYEQITTRCVGVDALIDPTAQRPKGRRADVGIRPYE